MKKFLILSVVLLLLAAGTASAQAMNGIGLDGNLVGKSTGAGEGGLGLTLRYGSFPVIGLEWNFMQDSSVISGSLDAWLVNQSIADRLSYYIGIGAYAAITPGNPPNVFNFGGRVPFGLQLFPVDPLEVFLELSPMIIFVPAIDWTVSVRLGARILY